MALCYISSFFASANASVAVFPVEIALEKDNMSLKEASSLASLSNPPSALSVISYASADGASSFY